MLTQSIVKSTNWRIVLTDVLVLAAVYFIPALSHLSPFPLYYLDPMRLFLFAGYILAPNHRNAYFLALTIPLFSSFVTGHPPFYKAILISIELLVNIAGFHLLLNKIKWPTSVLVFISIFFAKVFYYACKYVFIQLHLVDGNLITTGFGIQLIIMVALSIVFALCFKSKKR